MGIQLTKPLIVPEFETARVKLYVDHPVTHQTVALPPYTIDVQHIVTALFPGRTATANACALRDDDLFISNSSDDSQCIFKLPNYLDDGSAALAQAFVLTLVGGNYVGLAFDKAGNLFATEGMFGDNGIVKYTGTDKPFPGAAGAPDNNFLERIDVGNAGVTSYFANLCFDGAGNLWASDALNGRVVVFDAANLGDPNNPNPNTFHVLSNLTAQIPVANKDAALTSEIEHLFCSPEGIDFDGAGNLWVANNNDGLPGIQNQRTSLVQITPALQSAVLATANATALQPTVNQSGIDFFIYQLPNLNDDAGPRPQLGGMQIDRTAGRIYVNEEVAGHGRVYDVATIAAIGTQTADNDLAIISTSRGNGGSALVERELLVLIV